jgi:cytochrome c peroxidase
MPDHPPEVEVVKATREGAAMRLLRSKTIWGLLTTASVVGGLSLAYAQQDQRGATSYLPVDIKESFASIMARMKKAKPEIEKKHADLLGARYDLSNRPAKDATMSRGKPLQEGVRIKLPSGETWEQLASMSPAEIQDKNLFPKGFYPLPHPNHPEGGMVFPKFEINEVEKQEARDLTRFDLDFDLPDHFLPEFPPPIYLTTGPRRCLAGQAGHHRELLRSLQRHPES